MKLLLIFVLTATFSLGQDTVQPLPKMDPVPHSNTRLDSIARFNPVDFYTPEAEYDGGTKALIAFIQKNMNYPKEAIEQEIQGKVYLDFTVQEDGSIDSIKVARSAHPLLDAEAIRLISIMPNWIPAEYKGEKVAVRSRLPITFVLKDEE
ncbi:MAG: energy transducer TonB [bacterium]|nr:energy transducer TonB [bacterium]